MSEPTVTRNNSRLVALLRHPIQVRIGPDPEVGSLPDRVRARGTSRWITVTQHSRTALPGANHRLARLLGGVFLVTVDVDAPPGESGGEPGVLALLADS